MKGIIHHYSVSQKIYVADTGPMISQDLEYLYEMSIGFPHLLTSLRLEDTVRVEATNLYILVGQKFLCMVNVFVTQPACLLVHGMFQLHNLSIAYGSPGYGNIHSL